MVHQSRYFIICHNDNIKYSYYKSTPYAKQRKLNPFTQVRFKCGFGQAIFKLYLVIDGWITHCEIAIRDLSMVPADTKSKLVEIMAWCSQAVKHNPSPQNEYSFVSETCHQQKIEHICLWQNLSYIIRLFILHFYSILSFGVHVAYVSLCSWFQTVMRNNAPEETL